MPETVTWTLYRDTEAETIGSIGFGAEGEECSVSGPDLWLGRDEWHKLGRPECIVIEIRASE